MNQTEIFQNSPFLRLHAQIEGSDPETERDHLAIKDLMKKRDQMCSDLTIGKGINPESVEKMKAICEKLISIVSYQVGAPSILSQVIELSAEAKEALKAAKV